MTVMIEKSPKSFIFAGWTLHDGGRLTGREIDIQLPPKEGSVLRLLLVSGGSLMTKDRLLALAWPSGEVADESLTRCIYALRKHLRADKGFIKTVYGKGYRFTCPVQVQDAEPRRGMHVCSACGKISSV
ncbi:winged helix-turn-helix domain-containing protein [Pseudomonas fluorescens]|uniref:Winged helix-turn-helix domain-containing protein n=1 Tax=Pseudomonas fluorescens TaxID=294 RepID=A0AAE2PVP1_PSEFL|nr:MULTISPECIES: winged helix-turn-helix domain-containing protein [Pseudomonas fluorescens group]MBA1431589.1 transcriptional regulator [Pseudomonas orientalis]MBD8149790.1 winged helix-turn-helix domain-containing protein [Pseudomonas fluorescens]MBD8176838.1 winged helix-turn-helix domain-containing protein [Pseudomonas fluorescens]MBD8269223.1 winged helix-turn-helix domain-containing protein [Pseudomonas fluorescens]MBD8745696.1 winged helix-turn-helix domain-containing protein [Pseudomon